MHPRSLRSPKNICMQCQWHLWGRKHGPGLLSKPPWSLPRPLHAAATHRQQPETSLAPGSNTQTLKPALLPRLPEVPLREHLVWWQQQYGKPSQQVLAAFERHPGRDGAVNDMAKMIMHGTKADEFAEQPQWSAFDDEAYDDLITIGLFLKPGDVVELSQSGREPVLAVFVRQLETDCQFFSINGRWCHSALGQVAFAIPGCIDPALLEPLLPYLPTDSAAANPKGEVHVPVELGDPVQRILEEITQEAEKVYRAKAPVLDTAYDVLADSNRMRMMTLTEIAKALLAKKDTTYTPSPAALLAVRKSLNHNEFRFRTDKRSHRLTNVFAIRPKEDVKVVEKVHGWIREYREYLAASATNSENHEKCTDGVANILEFLSKARQLIALSRRDREPNDGVLGPSKTRVPRHHNSTMIETVWGETFSEPSKQIIEFIQAWVLTDQFVGMAGYQSACPCLIMATSCYGSGAFKNYGMTKTDQVDMDRSTGYVFLQEIGVISPYENPAIYNEHLMLPTVRISRNLEILNTRAQLLSSKPDFQDSMADLRRDWSSTTIYCIDDPGAQEIDDGVSIERIDGEGSGFWIHVHVANPTSHFDKSHVLSGLAAHMTETVYTPERSFPMLPPWATHGFFDLKSGRPILTFSSRIDASGNVLETKIQPGIARKVVALSPSEVSAILGEEVLHKNQTLVVGGNVPSHEANRTSPKVDANQAQLRDMQDLYTAAKVLWEKRRAAGGIRMTNFESRIRVFEHAERTGLTWAPPSSDQARHIRGDPIIEINAQNPRGLLSFEVHSGNIVEEMMILACQTAASWCTERGIPVVYRGTVDPPKYGAESTEDLRMNLVIPHYEQYGEVPRSMALRYINSLGRAIAHSGPLPHKIIGVPSYVKVTSPLRRFSDMIAHWQIEAAIRHEARTGKKLSLTDDTRGILPFTKTQIQESIVTLSPKERTIRHSKRASSRFWSNLAMIRALHYKEAPLPDTFKMWIKFIPQGFKSEWVGAQGVILDYGVEARLVDTPDVQLGDEWEVQIKHINPFVGMIYAKCVRLIHRDSETG